MMYIVDSNVCLICYRFFRHELQCIVLKFQFESITWKYIFPFYLYNICSYYLVVKLSNNIKIIVFSFKLVDII
jgi:hypothetical protein